MLASSLGTYSTLLRSTYHELRLNDVNGCICIELILRVYVKDPWATRVVYSQLLSPGRGMSHSLRSSLV